MIAVLLLPKTSVDVKTSLDFVPVSIRLARRHTVILISLNNKAKRFANQLLSDVIEALAYVYCYVLRAELTGCRTTSPRSYPGLLLTAFP